jgi:hypothetical protein
MTAALRSTVKTLVDAVISGQLQDFYGVRGWVAQYRALPLVGDIGGLYALGEDGRMVSAAWEDMDDVSEVRTIGTFNKMLCAGSRRYPELQPFIPERPPQAVDCKSCGGTGRLDLPNEKLSNVMNCACGGLGWILPLGRAQR